MNAKEYLLQYKRLSTMVNILQAEIEQLRTDAESMNINLDGMPRSSGGKDKTARLAIELAEHETKLTRLLSSMWRTRMEIVDSLGKLTNTKHQQLLYLRYIEGKTWEHIAVEMDITWRHCYRLHGSALVEFEEVSDEID